MTSASSRRRAGSAMTRPQIDALDVGVGLYFRRGAVLEDGAVVHHRHLPDHAKRHVEVMLDDDEPDMRWQRVQDLHELAPLARRKPGRRFVEQDKARRAGER